MSHVKSKGEERKKKKKRKERDLERTKRENATPKRVLEHQEGIISVSLSRY